MIIIDNEGELLSGEAQDIIPPLWESLLLEPGPLEEQVFSDRELPSRVVLVVKELSTENLIRIGKVSYAYAICATEVYDGDWLLDWVAHLEQNGDVDIVYRESGVH